MIETEIRTRLLADGDVSGQVGTRVYVLRSEERAALPLIVINAISRNRHPSSAGPNTFVTSRVQIDCYAASYIAARTLASYVRVSLNGLTGAVGSEFFRSCLLDSENDIDEPPLKGQDKGPVRVSQDYMIQHTESLS